MIIEWVGCSGTGKSTLCEAVYKKLRSSGIGVRRPLEVFLGTRSEKIILNQRLQNIALDLLVLPWSIYGFIKYRQFLNFCLEILNSGHFKISQKINLLRSILRKTGLHIFLSNLQDKNQAILVDEGTVHIAHLLFANGATNDVPPKKIERFCELVPEPSLIIHVMAPESEALERTLNRKDKPISDSSSDSLIPFIGLGHKIFEILHDLAPWKSKTIEIYNPNTSNKNNEEIVLVITKQIADYLSTSKP